MVLTTPLFFALAGFIALTTAAPHNKRIAQVISDSTQQWVQACKAAGGKENNCQPTSQIAFSALLAAAGDCDQQNAADTMIDYAKVLNNDPKMISLAQVFAQQPRNSPDKLSVKYCQQKPRNPELNGLFQCQFQGVDPQIFTKNVKVGAPGTIPLGLSAPLNPPGSCKAHPQGGIPDGTQLVALTQNPGVNNTLGSSSSNSSSPPTNVGSSTNSTDCPIGATVTSTVTVTATPSASTPGTAASVTPTNSAIHIHGAQANSTIAHPSTTGGFQLQNGHDAQALNTKFASLTPSSPCNEGDQACINQGFAQCIGGKFVTTQCAGGTQCFALPLSNTTGMSIACTTPSHALSMIQATGVSGNVTSA